MYEGKLFMVDMNCRWWVSHSGSKSGPWEDGQLWANNRSFTGWWADKATQDANTRIRNSQTRQDEEAADDKREDIRRYNENREARY